MRAALLTGVAISVLFALAGCATVPDVPANADNPLPIPSLGVVLQPGDVVEVKLRFWPELNELQTIRPDGMISLQLVDEVKAAGLTPSALRDELLTLYDTELKNPEVVVIARVEENRNVYVGGEVNIFRNSDGLVQIPLIGTLTPWEAILQAGGIKERTASLSNVLIVRRIEGKQYARTIDLRGTFKMAESEPLLLQPNDIIYVPRNKTDRMNQWVDQYLSKTVPTWVTANIDVVELIRNNRNVR